MEVDETIAASIADSVNSLSELADMSRVTTVLTNVEVVGTGVGRIVGCGIGPGVGTCDG
jgi:hypothetical protein